MMKKPLLTFAVANIMLIGSASAIPVVSDAVFTVKADPSQPACGLTAQNPDANLGDALRLDVLSNTGYDPFIQIKDWDGSNHGALGNINDSLSYLKGISTKYPRPVDMKNADTATATFSLNKRPVVSLRGANPTSLTVEIICVENVDQYRENFTKFSDGDDDAYTNATARHYDFTTGSFEQIDLRYIPSQVDYDRAPGFNGKDYAEKYTDE